MLYADVWRKADSVQNVSDNVRSHWGADKWYKQVNVVNNWQTEQEWFVDVKQGWNCFNLTDFPELG